MRTRAVSSAPPFCPNEACEHHCAPTSSWRWLRAGFFSRRAAPCRIQRYRCVDCGRYFSEQTFRTTYWLRCPQLLEETCHALTHGKLSQGRVQPKGELTEPLALDGFRTFQGSQYHPSEFHQVVGQHSHFVHGFTHSELRRSGTMTARQRARREALERTHGRPDPKSVEREVARVLGIVTAGAREVELHTDENPAYVRDLTFDR